MLRILEDKGHVRHEQDGPRYVYLPDRRRATAPRRRRCATCCRPSSTARRNRRCPRCSTNPIPGSPIASSTGWPGSSIARAAPERNDDHHRTALAWLPLADAVAKTTVILLAAAAASFVLRHASAALRHLVWTLALCSALFLPIVSLALPKWQLPLVDDRDRRPRRSSARLCVGTVGSRGRRRSPTAPRPRSRRPTRIRHAGTGRAPRARPGCRRCPGRRRCSAIWLLGAAVILARIAVGLVAVRWLSRRTQDITDAAWLPMAMDARARDGRQLAAALPAQRPRQHAGRGRASSGPPSSCRPTPTAGRRAACASCCCTSSRT